MSEVQMKLKFVIFRSSVIGPKDLIKIANSLIKVLIKKIATT